MKRYSVINEKNPREIVMLRSTGCSWKQCIFCDYHLDSCRDAAANYKFNCAVLANVTGIYKRLEVINSGSFCELDEQTMEEIVRVCRDKNIKYVHFECHWLYRDRIPELRRRFADAGSAVLVKQGVETFDYNFRENVLHKGIAVSDPVQIAEGFDECCLLFGLTGQTADSMKEDIRIALDCFKRVCINIMTANSTSVIPDSRVINTFMAEIYPIYKNDERVDILIENTDFGVGEKE